LKGSSYQNFYVGGKSVGGIDEVISAGEIIRQFAEELK
jgi:hypothetical protein